MFRRYLASRQVPDGPSEEESGLERCDKPVLAVMAVAWC
jgi:hypothetical protein